MDKHESIVQDLYREVLWRQFDHRVHTPLQYIHSELNRVLQQ